VKDPLQALIEAGALPASSFPPSSRYAKTPLTTYDPGDGSGPIAHLQRRLVPPPERQATLGEHVVVAGDRLDLIAARQFGDPELWWRLCDANPTQPSGPLTDDVGRRLRIAGPDGVPGVADVG
jgi:hypothetical protein